MAIFFSFCTCSFRVNALILSEACRVHERGVEVPLPIALSLTTLTFIIYTFLIGDFNSAFTHIFLNQIVIFMFIHSPDVKANTNVDAVGWLVGDIFLNIYRSL